MGARGLASLGCVVPRAANTTIKNKVIDKRRKDGHARVLKISVVGIKETLTEALKQTEDMLRMPREDKTSPYSGGFVEKSPNITLAPCDQ